jgi:cob(I)alamin adenosyltransferase
MKSSIYTRTGDKGQTSLIDGTRVSKDALRVEAYGTVDEANSWIGAARAQCDNPFLESCLQFVQHRFFNCSSNLATPPGAPYTPPRIAPEDIAFLETAIDRFESGTGPLRHFIVPGGGKAAGYLHIARTVCRRAERRLVTLAAREEIDEQVRAFINRASDFLFAAARYANAVENRPDVAWNADLPIPELED